MPATSASSAPRKSKDTARSPAQSCDGYIVVTTPLPTELNESRGFSRNEAHTQL